MTRRLRRGLLATLTCLGLGASFGSQFEARAQTSLSPDQLRQTAVAALKGGDPVLARNFAQALLARDPEDVNALLILARAARDMGDIPPARQAASQAWTQATSPEQRYSAALITAQVLSSDGKRTMAQLWLRRAAQIAPSDLLREKAKRDFAYVKQRNPWKTELSFTLAPNTNINNGSAKDRSRLNYAISELLFGEQVEFELSDTAQAISGIEIGAAMRTRYRFHQTEKSAHDAKLFLSYRSFIITDTLEKDTVSGSDFAFGSVAMGYGYRNLNLSGKGEFALDTEVGQSWYGGARYASYMRGQVQQSWRIGPARQLRFGGDIERLWGQATPDVDTFGLSTSITQGFASGNTGYLGMSLTTTRSPEVTSEYGEVTLRGGLALKRPILGAAVQLGIGASWRDYDVSRHARDGRQDTRIFGDITATFTQIDYYGFNPSVTLSASTTDSNVSLYDVNRMGLNIGIKSAF